MPTRDHVVQAIKDLVLPELQGLRTQMGAVEHRLAAVEKRMDDFAGRFLAIDEHLVDQSRRIDQVRSELGARTDQQTALIEEVRSELGARIDQQTARVDELIAQVGRLDREVAALRHDRAVTEDILRRIARLEEKAA